jgi:hypothetical protein
MIRTIRWRRLDHPGLELLHWSEDAGGARINSTIIDAGPQPFALRYEWRLVAKWRSVSLDIEHLQGERSLSIERNGASWLIDGVARPDLAACDEIDVSATPLCNGLAINVFGASALTALYIDAADLSVRPSRQRYERLGDRGWRYIDEGVAAGFEATLELGADGLVQTYEGLFERIT